MFSGAQFFCVYLNIEFNCLADEQHPSSLLSWDQTLSGGWCLGSRKICLDSTEKVSQLVKSAGVIQRTVTPMLPFDKHCKENDHL